MKKRVFLLTPFLLLFFVSNGLATVLNVPEKFQEQNQWCWAGSAQAVLSYYGTTVAQCDMADFARINNGWGADNCCSNPTGVICNQPNYMYGTAGSLQAIMVNWGVNSNSMATYLSQPTVGSETDAGRPFVMRFGWYGGGGHFLVGRGLEVNNVYYMDPWPGNGYTISTYDWVVYAPTHHDWTHTLQITTPGPFIYVDDDSDCPGTGTEGDPYCDIATAIAAASADDLIIVKDGTYTGSNNRSLDFDGKAITLRSENGAASTIIDSEGFGSLFYFNSGETSSSVVDGFTITGGSPIVYGGGIYITNSSSPTIKNCIITGNRAAIGGGIFCGPGSPTVTNCVITGNVAYDGGGIGIDDSSTANISNCTIAANMASVDGGGIYCESALPTIQECILWGNSAPLGTQISLRSSSVLTLWDSDVQDLSGLGVDVEGGSVLNDMGGNIDADPLFVNPPDFVDETTDAGTTTTVEVADASIFAVNDVIEYARDGVARTVSSASGTTVTFAPALSGASDSYRFIRNFGIVGSVPEDFHLEACSPCVDTGNSGCDYSNEPYPNGGNINMGAYGNTSEATRAGCNYDAFFEAVPDVDGNGHYELVMQGVNPDNGKVLAQVWDAESAIRTTNVWYGPVFIPKAVGVLPDISGNGKSEIVMMGLNALNGKVLGHTRDAFLNTYIRYTWFGSSFIPMGLRVMGDISGNNKAEIIELGLHPDNNKGVAKVYDAFTGTLVKLVWYGPVFNTKGLVVLPDTNGNGKPDLVLLGLHPTNGKVLAHIRDSLTGTWIRYVWFGTDYHPIDLKYVGRVDGNLRPDLGLLGVDNDTGNTVVKVMDSYTKAVIRTTTFFSSGETPLAFESLPDMTANGRPELAVLAVDPSDGAVYVSVKDAFTGDAINTISYGSTREAFGLAWVPDISGNGYPELAVLTSDGGLPHAELRDASTGALVKDITLGPTFHPWP